ncbi:Protein Mpv17, partial [Trichinella nelsoni]
LHPWKSQMIISGLLMGTGDVISQTVLEGHRSYNFFEFDRTFRFVFLGTFYTGPLIWAWFVKLDKIFVGHSLFSVIKRVALDQLLFSPVSYTGFILLLGFLQRLNFENIKEKWKTEFRQVYLTNLQLWPAIVCDEMCRHILEYLFSMADESNFTSPKLCHPICELFNGVDGVDMISGCN